MNNKVRVILLLIAVSLSFLPEGPARAEAAPAEQPTSRAPTITLQSASGQTIEFETQNGEVVEGVPPETRDLPHLVLRRNGVLADPGERTLSLEVTGIEVPPSGVTITLNVETQHGDPDVDDDSPPRIPVWRESQRIANTTGITQTGVAVVFRHGFGETVRSGSEAIATPTGYFRYDLLVTDAQQPVTDARYAFSQDYAFLMESQWIVPLPEVREASPGAAPEELIIYYCDMFPFRRDVRDASTWLSREKVSGYIHSELIPGMIEAYRVQTDDWGFPWYPEWTGHRPGKDEERLSVALADGQTWFHGKAPGQGNSAISINVSRGKVEYDTLVAGLLSTFHHELFHNHQRNIYQHLGGSGQVGGAGGAWEFITEGMAVLASSVGQPDVQFSRSWGSRAYALNAKGFLGREGISQGGLNESYAEMNGYHGAAYWRFLYEQCGGMRDGIENPAPGMALIRKVLLTLYAGDVVDIVVSADVVRGMPAVLDEALRGSSCPFETYQESLLAFARAIYALRLDEGRCRAPGSPAGCGFYDPQDLYHNPPAGTITYQGEEIVYSAAEQPYPTGIPSSFGIDLIEVKLEAATPGKALTIEIHGAPGSGAVLNVQLWKPASQPLASEAVPQGIVQRREPDGAPVHIIPAIDAAGQDRLGLIITRVDARERLDPKGTYTIVLRPDA
ncbi:MAG: hypothetical protein PVJ26_20890 [Anaerolineae bacterium]|jgi:hypothetical protein